jgi:thiamine transport system permease protein
VRIAIDATVIAVLLGVLVSLLLSRRPRSRALSGATSALDGLFMLPLGVSAVTVGFGFLVTLNRPPLDLRSSVVLVPIAQAVVALPLVIRTLLPVLRAIDTRTRDAAAVLGASPRRVLLEIDLPVLGRSLGVAVALAYAVSLGEFGATSFLYRPDQATLPVVVARLITRPGPDNLGMALAAAVVLAVLVMAVMAAAERLRVSAWSAQL